MLLIQLKGRNQTLEYKPAVVMAMFRESGILGCKTLSVDNSGRCYIFVLYLDYCLNSK